MLFKKYQQKFDKAFLCGIMRLLLREKSIGNKPKKLFSKKVKEKVDNTKTKWYITFRYRKKGANNMLKDLIKKVLKKLQKKLTTTK